MGAGAFHALIRLGYALTLLNETHEIASTEIIVSFFYWENSFLDLGELPPSSKNTTTPTNSLTHILKQDYTFPEVIKGNIFQLMQFVQQRSHFNGELKPLNTAGNTLTSIANLLLELYLPTNDFTLLHGLTATHALRIIMPYLSDLGSSINYFWIALITAALSIKPEKNIIEISTNFTNETSLNWEELKQYACQRTDEYVIKLVYTAWQEYQYYGDERYRTAAAIKLKIGLI